MDEMEQLARDLTSAADTITRRARGAGAKAVDAMAATAQQNAIGSWTRYGRGMAGAAGTIRGRMSRDASQVRGYVMGDEAAFYQEIGTVNHPPQPAIGPAADQHEGLWASQIEDAGGDVLR
jgi:hypothetical protein